MQQLHAKQVASITELKRNPSQIIERANGESVAILNHNVVAAYLIPTAVYENLLELVAEKALQDEVVKRLDDGSEPIAVNLDEL